MTDARTPATETGPGANAGDGERPLPVTFDGVPVQIACLQWARLAKKRAVSVYRLSRMMRPKYREIGFNALLWAIEIEDEAFQAQTANDADKLGHLNEILRLNKLVHHFCEKFYAGSGVL